MMRVLPDSESDKYKKAAKGSVMIKTNPRGEYDAMDEVQNWAERADWLTKRVIHTYRNDEKGTAQEDLERAPSGLTMINAGAVRSAQVTMMAHMVRHTENEMVRDTGHAVVEGTHDARGIPSPLRRLE